MDLMKCCHKFYRNEILPKHRILTLKQFPNYGIYSAVESLDSTCDVSICLQFVYSAWCPTKQENRAVARNTARCRVLSYPPLFHLELRDDSLI